MKKFVDKTSTNKNGAEEVQYETADLREEYNRIDADRKIVQSQSEK